MLILTRKLGECIYIGNDIIITLVDISGCSAKFGINAPEHIRILREELWYNEQTLKKKDNLNGPRSKKL